MLLAQPDKRLMLGIKMGMNTVVRSANSARMFGFPFALRIAVHIVEHLIEPADNWKHGMIRMSPPVLTVQFPVVVHLDRNHAGTIDETFLLVHDNLGRLFPSTNNPFSVLIKTHRHGILLGAAFRSFSAAFVWIHTAVHHPL